MRQEAARRLYVVVHALGSRTVVLLDRVRPQLSRLRVSIELIAPCIGHLMEEPYEGESSYGPEAVERSAHTSSPQSPTSIFAHPRRVTS